MTPHEEPSAARTLDAIRDGAGNLLLAIRQRVIEAGLALDEGGFDEAMGRLGEARQMLAPLAQAEQQLAIADTARVVRARELEVGMKLTNVGEITDVTPSNCDSDGCSGHYLVTVGENAPMMLDAEAAVFVEVEATD